MWDLITRGIVVAGTLAVMARAIYLRHTDFRAHPDAAAQVASQFHGLIIGLAFWSWLFLSRSPVPDGLADEAFWSRAAWVGALWAFLVNQIQLQRAVGRTPPDGVD